MSRVYLSKSKYCKAVQCNKILWMDKYKTEVAVQTARDTVLENGTKVGELARNLFGNYINVEYNKDLNVMVEETKNLLKDKPNIITEASFNYDNNFCSVDILKNNIDGVEIYEVKSSTEIHDIYLDDASYQYYVLKSLGINVISVNIVYLNSKYVKNGDIELNKLFNIEDITYIAIRKQDEIKNKIEEINKYMLENAEKEPEKDIDMYCFNPYECPYWKYCSRHLPPNNVFDIRIMHKNKKFDFYKKGIIKFEDIANEDINPKYLEQVIFEINNKPPKIEIEKIREFMKELTYPLYFLDFETFQLAIPEFDGTSPYMQIPFQYSLHYVNDKDGELYHKEFLAEAGCDPRRRLAERLIEDIPTDACVLAYNMSFEKTVIKKLANYYEDLHDDLIKIHDNIKDLMIPFYNRDYYVREMKGSYSIKYVLPALFPDDPDLDYHNLPVVHNGGEASDAFLSLTNLSKEEQEKVRNGLLVYCKLDTYAMVKIWERLNEIIK